MSFNVLAVGDSVIWGQGLRKREKFHELSSRMIVRELGIEQDDLRIIHFARSGAVIDEPDLKPPLVGTTGAWQEVPHATPTILDQVDKVSKLRAISGADVHLAIINGGINDINFRTILDPRKSLIALENSLQENCYHDMKRLIAKTRQMCPNAIIIVTGYYPIISSQSNREVVGLIVSLLSTIAEPLADALVKISEFKAGYFYRRSLRWLRQAIGDSHADPQLRGPGILFAHPAFGRQNSVGASNPFLFGPKGNDIINTYFPGVVHLYNPDDPVFRQRLRACNRYLTDDNLGFIDKKKFEFTQLQCRFASIGHPNQAGARRYAEVISQTYLSYRNMSLRTHLSRILPNETTLNVRKAMQRHKLPLQTESLRDFLQHMVVDCIEVTIATKDVLFAGTDDDVFLRLGNGLEWKLGRNINLGAVSLWADLSDDFEQGDTNSYTIDPADGNPNNRLHLGQITELSLVKRKDTLFSDDWRPESIRLRLNGLTVYSGQINQELKTGNSVWTAPDFPA